MTTTTPAGSKDRPSVDSEWRAKSDLIENVQVREVRNVVTRNGITTELFRAEWGLMDNAIAHMIHVTLRPGALSAWHMHKLKTDYLFVVSGLVRLVLYDGRDDSPTFGHVNEFHLSHARPQVIAIPPNVFHGLQNLDAGNSTFVNYFDAQYEYEDPDDWRAPLNTEEIPYRFA
jgi:dTDP-4-dehydrorhamnose 3,5-epimerase